MNRALVYLLAIRLKHTVFGRLRRPGRLIGVLLLLVLFAAMVISRRESAVQDPNDPALRGTILVAVLALYVLLAVLGGIGEPGLGFLPADLDYVLPGPFRRREVLAYHLARQYGQILILGLVYVVFLGAAALPQPGLAYAGTVLCLALAAHLQVASTLVAGHVGDRVFRRMRRASRVAVIAVLVVAAVFAFAGLAGTGDLTGLLQRVLASGPARILLFPALMAGRAATALTPAAALGPLLVLAGLVAGSFLLVLAFPFDVVETTYVTAVARRQAIKTRSAGAGGSRGSQDPGRRFRGAAAVTWLNTLMLRRRLRVVVALVAMLLVILLVSGARRGGSPEGTLPPMLGVLAFFPVIANIPLGFRGYREHLELLKTLPTSPRRLALAQVFVPVLLIYGAQLLALVAFLGIGKLSPLWAGIGAGGLPLLDLGVVAVVETFQLGRDPRQAGFLWAMLQMLGIVTTVIPAAVGGALAYDLTGRVDAAVLVGVGVHVLVVVGLVVVLGWRFRTWEPGGV